MPCEGVQQTCTDGIWGFDGCAAAKDVAESQEQCGPNGAVRRERNHAIKDRERNRLAHEREAGGKEDLTPLGTFLAYASGM